jgi:hypothetical protein
MASDLHQRQIGPTIVSVFPYDGVRLGRECLACSRFRKHHKFRLTGVSHWRKKGNEN